MSIRSSSSDQALDSAKGVKGHFQAAQLFHAAARNKTALLEKLLSQGVSPHIQGYGSELRQPNGKSALHMAALKGHQESIRLLLQYGARVNQRDYWERTPMDDWAEWLVGKMIRDVPFHERVWSVVRPNGLEKFFEQREVDRLHPKAPLTQKKETLLDGLSSIHGKEAPFDWSPFEEELRCLQILKNAGGQGGYAGTYRLSKIHWTWEHVDKGLAWLNAHTLKTSLEKELTPAVESSNARKSRL